VGTKKRNSGGEGREIEYPVKPWGVQKGSRLRGEGARTTSLRMGGDYAIIGAPKRGLPLKGGGIYKRSGSGKTGWGRARSVRGGSMGLGSCDICKGSDQDRIEKCLMVSSFERTRATVD